MPVCASAIRDEVVKQKEKEISCLRVVLADTVNASHTTLRRSRLQFGSTTARSLFMLLPKHLEIINSTLYTTSLLTVSYPSQRDWMFKANFRLKLLDRLYHGKAFPFDCGVPSLNGRQLFCFHTQPETSCYHVFEAEQALSAPIPT